MDCTVFEKMICAACQRSYACHPSPGIAYFSKAFPLVSGVATLVYELHLFEDRRLAGLARTQQQHLDLISETQLVSLQLVLNLLIPLLPLLGL